MRYIRHFVIFLVPFFCLIFLSSCDNSKSKAKEVIQQFQIAYLNENHEGVEAIYPDLAQIGPEAGFRNLDQINIKSFEEDTSCLKVTAEWMWTDSLTYSNDVIFYIASEETEGETKYYIKNTQNMIDFSGSSLYRYAQKKEPSIGSMSDVDKAAAIAKYSNEFADEKRIVYNMIAKNLAITSLNWWRIDDRSVRGIFTVYNNTSLDLPEIKYTVTYYSQYGDIISTDEGAKPGLQAHKDLVGTFTSIGAGYPYRAEVECYVDDVEFVEERVIEAAIPD